MNCLSHGEDFMDHWGRCLACEEADREEVEPFERNVIDEIDAAIAYNRATIEFYKPQ